MPLTSVGYSRMRQFEGLMPLLGRCVEDPPVIRADEGRAVEEALDQRVVLVGTRSLKGVDVAIRIS